MMNTMNGSKKKAKKRLKENTNRESPLAKRRLHVGNAQEHLTVTVEGLALVITQVLIESLNSD